MAKKIIDDEEEKMVETSVLLEEFEELLVGISVLLDEIEECIDSNKISNVYLLIGRIIEKVRTKEYNG